MIGVGAFVSVYVTSESTRSATRKMFQDLSGSAPLEVVASGEAGMDPALASRLAGLPDVAGAVPVVRRTALLVGPDGRAPVAVLGIQPGPDAAVRRLSLAAGRSLADENGVLLQREFARGLGLALRTRCRLVSSGGTLALPVSGLLRPTGATAWNGGAVAYVRLQAAQELFALEGRVTAIQLLLKPGIDPETAAAAVRPSLPAGLRVEDTAARASISASTLLSVDRGLSSVSVMSLVAGAFIILNTFLMSVRERRRAFAILRAVGVTRAQLLRLLLGEALLLSVVGTVLGAGLGLAASLGMRVGIEHLLRMTLPGVVVPVAPFLIAAGIGPGMALAATYFPARRVARRPILQELYPESTDRDARWPAWVPVGGLGLLLLSVLACVGFRQGVLSPAFVGPASALMMVGCVLAAPLVLRPVFSALRRTVGARGGLASRMAFAHLDRHRGFTALTAAVLSLAVIVAIGMGNSIRGNVTQLGDWFDQAVPGDFFVRLAEPDAAALDIPALPPEVLPAIRKLPGLRRADPVAFLPVDVSGKAAILIARPFPAGSPLRLPVAEGDPHRAATLLHAGGVALGTLLAQRIGAGPGDRVALATPSGTRQVPVAAVVTEYTAGGDALYMEYDAATRLFKIPSPSVVVVDAAPGERESAAASLHRFCAAHGLLLQTNADLRAQIQRMVLGISGLLWALLLLVFVVASLGVVNTLSMNVLEQTREIGLLRAVALTRRQIGRYVRSQGLLLAVAGIPPGVATGILVAFGMHFVSRTLLGVESPFRLDPMVLVVSPALAVATALLATIPPARHAARLRVAEAVTWE